LIECTHARTNVCVYSEGAHRLLQANLRYAVHQCTDLLVVCASVKLGGERYGHMYRPTSALQYLHIAELRTVTARPAERSADLVHGQLYYWSAGCTASACCQSSSKHGRQHQLWCMHMRSCRHTFQAAGYGLQRPAEPLRCGRSLAILCGAIEAGLALTNRLLPEGALPLPLAAC